MTKPKNKKKATFKPRRPRGRPKKENPEPTERIYVRLSPELAEKLKAEAEQERRSVSAQMAVIVERHFET